MFVDLRKKLNIVLVFATAALAFANSTSAQTQPPPSKQVSLAWTPTSDQLNFNSVTKVGGIYLRKATDELPMFRDHWFLELGGDPATLTELVPAIVRDYSTQHLEVRILESTAVPKPGEIRVVLKGGTARKELSKEDFTQDELSGLRKMKNAGDSADKWVRNQVTRPALALWVRKYTGGLVLPDDVGIPDITDSDFDKSTHTAKLSAWVFYRSQEHLKDNPTLWESQQKELSLVAERLLRFHGLITVRKVATDAEVCGKVMYKRLADDSWNGKPVVVLFWGGSNARKWAPFTSGRQDVLYADDIEKQVLSYTGLDKLLTPELLATSGGPSTTGGQPCPTDGDKKVASK